MLCAQKHLCWAAIVAVWAVFSAISVQGGLIADPVADFSSTQGQGGWYYGYFNVSAHGGVYHAIPGGVDDFEPFTFSMPLYEQMGNGQDDLSVLTGAVPTVPEPAILILILLGISLLMRRTRYVKFQH